MLKLILALTALLFASCAEAHVSAVPFPEIGSLKDVTQQAAFFMPQTYLPLSRGDVICDVTTGVATGVGAGTCVAHPATCNGDLATVTRTATLTSGVGGSKYLNVSVNTFTSGDVGKAIYVLGAGLPNNVSTIATFTDAQNIVLSSTGTVFGPTSTTIQYGTDDALAFSDFSSWANLTWQTGNSGLVEQYIPSGKACQILSLASLVGSTMDPGCASPSTYPPNCTWGGTVWSKGIKKFLMNFAGASVTGGLGISFALGAGDGVCHQGIGSVEGCTARTASASIGATSITLLDTSLCSRFAAGLYVVMTGYDTQGIYAPSSGFGYPPNPAFYDYAVVTSTAACAGSGVITLDRALTNDYKSTWPLNCPGGTFEADCGGPATLYALPFWWNVEAEYRGGTFNNGSNQTNGQGRSITYRNVNWTGGVSCTYPSQSIDWTVIGGDWATTFCDVELDKIVVNATLQNANVYKLAAQSGSPRFLTISGSTLNQMGGTPRNTTISNTSVTDTGNAFIGVTSFGRTDSFTCTNCVMNGVLNYKGPIETGAVSAGVWALPGQGGGPYNSSMAAGVITIPNTHGAVSWAVPGTNILWSYSGKEAIWVYQVLDVTQDATNQYITTNCVGVNTVCGVGGGLPVASGNLSISGHPAPKFNCRPCSGTALWSAVSNGPVDAPLFSYQKYTADITFPISNQPSLSFRLWGKLTSLIATVNNPYAGAGILNFRPISQFTYLMYDPSGATGSYTPLIDLKTGGTRTIGPSGCVGCGGADSGTAFPFTSSWSPAVTGPNISSHPAWAGTIDITLQTDQGVVP